MEKLIDIIVHTDDTLLALAADNVNKVYLILFLFVMLETGMIFFPFLPGDGLLFSAGVVAATTDLDIRILLILLISAAILGNGMNFVVGSFLGNKMRRSNNYFIKNHLMIYMPRAEAFYEKHGGRAIVIGRFFPIIRTYIPFLAGVVKMPKPLFIKNSILGALAWVLLFLLTGFYVGEIEWVKRNYGLIFLLLISTTLIPFIYSAVKKMIKKIIN